MNRLNLSLEPVDLKQQIRLLVAAQKPPMALSSFGKFARYLFVCAIEWFANRSGNVEGEKLADQFSQRAFDALDPDALKLIKLSAKLTTERNPTRKIAFQLTTYLRQWFRQYVKENPSIPEVEKDLFKRAVSFLIAAKTSTPATLKANEKIAWEISPHLGDLFNTVVRLNGSAETPTEESKAIAKDGIADLVATARETLLKLNGTRKLVISPELSPAAKADLKMPLLLKKYRDTINLLKGKFEAYLRKEAFSGPIPVEKLEKDLERLGFELQFFPSSKNGFKGMVGLDKGKMALFSPAGALLQGGIHPLAKVTMNPKYVAEKDNAFVLSFFAPNAVSQTRVYTVKYKAEADTEKHSDVEVSIPMVGKWIKAWQKDLKSKDLMRKVPAVVAYLLYMTGARVGSRTDSASKKGAGVTYGISTLRFQHVKVTGTSIIMDYSGKKGVHQRHVLPIASDPYLKICATVLKALKEGKKKDDLIFSFVRPKSAQGAVQEVNPTFFRAYMKSTGVTIKTHGLRHIRGTELVREILGSNPWKPSGKAKTIRQQQLEAEDFMKTKVLSKAAELLGHRATSKTGETSLLWRTSITSYINPALVRNFFLQHSLTVPKWVPAKMDISD